MLEPLSLLPLCVGLHGRECSGASAVGGGGGKGFLGPCALVAVGDPKQLPPTLCHAPFASPVPVARYAEASKATQENVDVNGGCVSSIFKGGGGAEDDYMEDSLSKPLFVRLARIGWCNLLLSYF